MIFHLRRFRRVLLASFCMVQLVCGFANLPSSPLQPCSSPKRLPERSSSQSVADVMMECPNDNDKLPDFDPWIAARTNLRDPKCCVVSVCSANKNSKENMSTECQTNSLQGHLAVLQEELADRGPSDIDIRVKIDTTTFSSAINDCTKVCLSMAGGKSTASQTSDETFEEAAATALANLAMGMASFADDCHGLDSRSGVFLRIVCASSYNAHDPVFHTDKAPLRGYATLRGVGTEFVTHPCSPLEYLSLRSLGGNSQTSIRCASELEFIVMKGDYYYRGNSAAAVSSWWQRAFACVHRSPPGKKSRRVIVSFDLADGDDDREWHDVHQKRQWRAGMTQRKSKLVA